MVYIFLIGYKINLKFFNERLELSCKMIMIIKRWLGVVLVWLVFYFFLVFYV